MRRLVVIFAAVFVTATAWAQFKKFDIGGQLSDGVIASFKNSGSTNVHFLGYADDGSALLTYEDKEVSDKLIYVRTNAGKLYDGKVVLSHYHVLDNGIIIQLWFPDNSSILVHFSHESVSYVNRMFDLPNNASLLDLVMRFVTSSEYVSLSSRYVALACVLVDTDGDSYKLYYNSNSDGSKPIPATVVMADDDTSYQIRSILSGKVLKVIK